MKPTKFKESNCTFAENQPEYLPLPAYKSKCPRGYVTSCWKLTWKERLKMLLTGRVFITVMTFREPLQPLMANVEFVNHEQQDQSSNPEKVSE